ncbi:UNVERIFIED_CONTAM: hypothetical protein FKN15_042592 [Acipenser sinensis]
MESFGKVSRVRLGETKTEKLLPPFGRGPLGKWRLSLLHEGAEMVLDLKWKRGCGRGVPSGRRGTANHVTQTDMGNSQCDAFSLGIDLLYYTAEASGIIPDASIDKMFLDHPSPDSLVVLQQHYKTVQSSFQPEATQLKAYIAGLLTALGQAAKITNGSVGFAALVISLIIDIVAHYTIKHSVKDVKDQIRSIFTEEKVSEIGNLVAEYLKRVQLHLDNPDLLVDDTFHYETAEFTADQGGEFHFKGWAHEQKAFKVLA